MKIALRSNRRNDTLLQKSKWSKFWHKITENWVLYLFILPVAIYVAIFDYAPMYGIQIAFRDFSFAKGVVGSKWVGLKWFKYFFQSANFWPVLRNTLTLSLYSLLTFPIPIIFALILHNIPSARFRKFAQTATYLPHFISIVVVVGMITSFTSYNSGWINTIIEALGGQRINFMAEKEVYPHLYVWTDVWQQVGWDSIIYLAALTSVSQELHEAATIDGASKLQRILNIDLPAIAPTVVIMLVLRCGSIMSIGFDKSYLMQNSMNMAVSEVLSTYSYKMGLIDSRYSYSAAVSLFNNGINFIILTIVNRIAKVFSGNSLW